MLVCSWCYHFMVEETSEYKKHAQVFFLSLFKCMYKRVLNLSHFLWVTYWPNGSQVWHIKNSCLLTCSPDWILLIYALLHSMDETHFQEYWPNSTHINNECTVQCLCGILDGAHASSLLQILLVVHDMTVSTMMKDGSWQILFQTWLTLMLQMTYMKLD